MEIAKLVISVLTPVSIALVGFLIQRALAQQSRTWKVQERLADKRVEIYEKVAEDLNKVFCYVMDVGGFKDETPETIIAAKRNVDKHMFMYQALWPVETFNQYRTYLNSAFALFQGAGEDAKIRARSFEKRSAYVKQQRPWPKEWDVRFTEETDPLHSEKYQALMSLISKDLMHSESQRR
jgi:hypothetical protein